ncbi:MAG: carbon-nitrogen hydrolase family protein [Terracidiphilus sp.]
MSIHRLLWIACLCCATAIAQAPANLIPNHEFKVDASGKPMAWQLWSPRPDLEPRSEVLNVEDARALRLTAVDISSFGKWRSQEIAVIPGHFYRFEVLYQPKQLVSERSSVGVMLSWSALDGRPLQRDYVDRIAPAENDWRRASRTLRAPEKASSVTIELWLRWAAAGSVIFSSPSLVEVTQPAPRNVRVVTTRIDSSPDRTIDANMKLMDDVLDKAGREKPDVVLLTETFTERAVNRTLHDRSEPIPGPLTDALGRKARQYHMYIIDGMLELDGKKIYDTAVLIDRNGQVAGKYRKTHLPLAEVEDGETPGSEYPVFDTDFGRIGMLICWDYFFPEPARILRLKGAEIVFLPIAGDPGARHWDVTSRARALDNGVYLVAATSEGHDSRIIDPDGEVMATTNDGIVAADLDLNKETRQWWLSVGPSDGEPKSLVIEERRPETYGDLIDRSR